MLDVHSRSIRIDLITDPGRRFHALAYAYAAGVALVMGVVLLGIPVQLSDSFTEFTAVHGQSLWQIIGGELYNGTYFRPLRRALIKIVYELSDGHYYLAFRG